MLKRVMLIIQNMGLVRIILIISISFFIGNIKKEELPIERSKVH